MIKQGKVLLLFCIFFASTISSSFISHDAIELEVDEDSNYISHTNYSINDQWIGTTTVTELLYFENARILSENEIDYIIDSVQSRKPMQIIWDNDLIGLILFYNNGISKCASGGNHLFGWTTNSVNDKVSIYYSENFVQLYLQINGHHELIIERWTESHHSHLNLTANVNDFVIYENDHSEYYESDWIEHYRTHTPSKSGLPIPIWNLNSVYTFNGELMRLGVYFDESVTTDERLDFCSSLGEVFALFESEIGVWLNLEFIGIDIPRYTNKSTGVIGYSNYTGNVNRPCFADFVLDTTTYWIDSDIARNGTGGKKAFSRSIPPPYYNRGAFIDSFIFSTSSDYWNWSSGTSSGIIGGCTKINGSLENATGIVMQTVGNSEQRRLLLAHEIAHSVNAKHSDAYCKQIMGFNVSSIMGTENSNQGCGFNRIHMNLFSFNQSALNSMKSNSNYSATNLPIVRYIAIPVYLGIIEVNGMALIENSIDVFNSNRPHPEDGRRSCHGFYRSSFTMYNLGAQKNYSNIFFKIRSTYMRNAPGEWDYWQGYDRPTNGRIIDSSSFYSFKDEWSSYFSGSGFIQDSTNRHFGNGLFDCQTNVNKAYQNHHPDQTWYNIWDFEPTFTDSSPITGPWYLFPSGRVSVVVG